MHAQPLTRPNGTLYCTFRKANAMGLKGSATPAWPLLSCSQLPDSHASLGGSTLVGRGCSLGPTAGASLTVMAAGGEGAFSTRQLGTNEHELWQRSSPAHEGSSRLAPAHLCPLRRRCSGPGAAAARPQTQTRAGAALRDGGWNAQQAVASAERGCKRLRPAARWLLSFWPARVASLVLRLPVASQPGIPHT